MHSESLNQSNDKAPTLDDVSEIESALQQVGFGRYHIELFIACALSVISVGFQNNLSSYIFPGAQCELNLSSSYLGIVNVSFLLGGLVGGFIWGFLADVKGRRNVLIFSHILNGIITIALALLSFPLSLVIFRFLNGFLIGAPGSIIFSYLGEFQPINRRAAIICMLGTFFTSAWIMLPIGALIVLPQTHLFKWRWYIFRLTPWRMLLLTLNVTELVAGMWFLKFDESAKFLYTKGNYIGALQVLCNIQHKNGVSGNFWKHGFGSQACVENFQYRDGIFKQMKLLFEPPLSFITLLISGITFANMFALFGLGLWLPELFARLEVDNFAQDLLVPLDNATFDNGSTVNCRPSFSQPVFVSTIVMGLSALIVNLVASLLIGRFHFRVIPLATMAIGGYSAVSLYWINSFIQGVAAASIFQATMVTANMAIGSISVNLFPTNVGAMGLSFTMSIGRMGAVISNGVFGYFMESNHQIPILLVSGIALLGSIICFLIPSKMPISKKTTKESQSDLCIISRL